MESIQEEERDRDTDESSQCHGNTLFAALSALLFVVVLGMVTSYSSPACVDMLKPGSRLSDITPDQVAWIASLPPLSGIVGNALSGYISLKLGRRAVLMFASVPYALSWLLIAYAPHVGAVYAGRLTSGLCAGVCSVAIPAYVAEVATVRTRGRLLAGFQVTLSAGVLLTVALGAAVRWSWLAAAGAAAVAVGAALLCAAPESPPWLARESRLGEAALALAFLRGRSSDTARELREIVEQLEDEPEEGLSLSEMLQPTLYKPALIAVALSLFQQFCGANALMSYSVELFQSTEDFLDPFLSAIVVALSQLLAAGLGSCLVDRVGRRVLYTASGTCLTLSLAILGAHSQMTSSPSWSWVPLSCFVVYIAAFAFGFGSMPFIVVPEMVPTHSRSFLLAVSSVSMSFFGFVVTETFDLLRKSLGMARLYWLYAAFTLLGSFFYLIFVPETKGRTVRDINRSFSIVVDKYEPIDNPETTPIIACRS